MPAAEAVRILLCAAEVAETDDVRQLLEQAGHQVIPHALASPDPENLADYQLVILEGSADDGAALRLGQRLRGRLAESFVPVLLIANDHAPSALTASLDSGVDACLLRPFSPGELLGQVRAFLRIKDLHDRLAEKTAEVYRINKRLQQAYHQIDQELELARRLQLSFLPQTFPDVPECRFAVHYWLRGQVGGDCYDVFRLDESHLGLYVADVVGHGVAASLLTIFVKKGLRAKDVFGQQYRLVPPGEVLERLNRELVGQALSESPFITMVYVLLNHRTGELRFARAGHPHPLYLPYDGDPQLWQVEGSLLGVFETPFRAETRQLRPGDKLLLYSDGIDAARYGEQGPGIDSLMACAAAHRALPVRELVERLAHDLFRSDVQPDDLTLLGLEMSSPSPSSGSR